MPAAGQGRWECGTGSRYKAGRGRGRPRLPARKKRSAAHIRAQKRERVRRCRANRSADKVAIDRAINAATNRCATQGRKCMHVAVAAAMKKDAKRYKLVTGVGKKQACKQPTKVGQRFVYAPCGVHKRWMKVRLPAGKVFKVHAMQRSSGSKTGLWIIADKNPRAKKNKQYMAFCVEQCLSIR